MNSHMGTTENASILEHYELFRKAAAVIASSSDLGQALANTISVCQPYLADFGFFDVVLDGGVRRTAHAHQNPELETLLNDSQWQRNERIDMNLCALSSGEPVLYENTDDDWYANAFAAPRGLAFRSMLSVPLWFGTELVGSLTLFMADSGRNHDSEHLKLAVEIAALATPVVVNARLLQRERLTQQALKQSEERLRLAMDAGKIGIWEWDIATNKVIWSKHVYDLHGLALDEFGGTVEDFGRWIHSDDRSRVMQNITQALISGDTLTDQFRIVRPDHSVRWLTTSSYIERNVSGQAVRMVGSAIDITESKNAQFGLQDLNRQLSKKAAVSSSERDRIWNLSHDLLVVASFSGYLVSVNPSFVKTLGWDEDELLSFPFMDLCHIDQREQTLQALQTLANHEMVENYEVQTLHKNGSYRWLCWTMVTDGDLIYAVGRDITDTRLQREQVQLVTEKRFQLALSASGMGAWQLDLLTGAVHWWPGMDDIHGLPKGTVITHAAEYLQFVHPDDLFRLSVIDELNIAKVFPDIEYRIIWPDGSVHWIESRREQILNQEGFPITLAGVCIDITQRKLSEQSLRFLAEASAEFADVIDHERTLAVVAQLAVPTFADWCTVDLLDKNNTLKRVAVCHVDPSKVQLAHNLHEQYPPDPSAPRGAYQILRTGEPELLPEISDEVLRESIQDEDYLAIIRQLGLRSYIGVPLSVRGKTLGVLTFISAESGRIYGSNEAALATEIGQRAAIAIENANFYRALKEADRCKDDFLAMLAHELRNPLAPIKSAADLLNLSQTSEQLKKTSEIIKRQVNHMTGLVDDLLDVSRVTRGQIHIEKKPVSLKRIISTALEQSCSLIESKRHLLNVQCEDVYLDGDEERLVQVISNLLTNAAKYTPEGGVINLSAKSSHEQVEIRVEDNGAGMSAELLASAFDLFVQGKRTSDRGQGGLGLGLALVKMLVSLHDGSIVARSEGEGFGSEFIIRFPQLSGAKRVEIEVEVEVETMPVPAPVRALRILIVDDNQDAADTLAMYLQVLGHEVHVVYDPMAALGKVEAVLFDHVVLDIGLPTMDGYELARQIRSKLGRATPVLVAVTGYGQVSDRDASLSAGIDHYFVKPLDVHLLLKLLNQHQF